MQVGENGWAEQGVHNLIMGWKIALTSETVGDGTFHVHGIVRVFKIEYTKSYQTTISEIKRSKWGSS